MVLTCWVFEEVTPEMCNKMLQFKQVIKVT